MNVLLLCLLLVGQPNQKVISVYPIYHPPDTFYPEMVQPVIRPEWWRLMHPPQEGTPITLELLIEYRDSCYADSTRHIRRFRNERMKTNEGLWMYTGGITRQDGPVSYGGLKCDKRNLPEIRDTIYTHKQPTFHGFIEWMRRRK